MERPARRGEWLTYTARALMATDLRLKLKELLIERLKFEDMTPDDIGDDEPLFAGGLGLDSIDALEIVVMLETEFGIKVKNESSARDYFRSIATLADLVEQKLAAAQSS
jgi:acyl carrier protein